MLIIYLVFSGAFTTLGLLLVIRSFLTLKENRRWGFVLFSLVFFVHDFILMIYPMIDSELLKCVEYILAYVIAYFIIKFSFRGSAVKNFAWIYGANFIYQAVGTTLVMGIFGVIGDFDVTRIESMVNTPSIMICFIEGITIVFSVAAGNFLIRILLKRNNRVIQVSVSLLAATGILAGAINSVESIYIIIPIIIVALIVGVFYQDKMLRAAEEQEKYYRNLEERQKMRQDIMVS